MRLGHGLVCLSVLLLTGCSLFSEKPVEAYRFEGRQVLQKQSQWSLEGRLALVDEKDSFSASLNWQHGPQRDDIELAGPLAQGKLVISVEGDIVSVDDGDNRKQFHGQVDEVLAEQLGVLMPVDALKYWVLGVPDPQESYVELADGFLQAGWRVGFKEMQSVSNVYLPKKISAEKDKTRVKLVVDQWELK